MCTIKPRISFLLIAMLLPVSIGMAEEFLRSDIPKEIDFIHAETHNMTFEQRLDWENRLAQTPDITNKEFELLWRYDQLKFDTQIGQVLYALSKRKDLSEFQLERITERMRSIAVGSLENLPPNEMEFLCLGLTVLKTHPSPKHEDFALRMLDVGNWRIKAAAAATLGKIGSSKAIEPMRLYVDSKMQMIAPSLRETAVERGSKDSLLAAQQELLTRVRLENRRELRQHGYDTDQSGSETSEVTDLADRSGNSDGHNWILYAFIPFLVIGVIVWLLWGRFTKK